MIAGLPWSFCGSTWFYFQKLPGIWFQIKSSWAAGSGTDFPIWSVLCGLMGWDNNPTSCNGVNQTIDLQVWRVIPHMSGDTGDGLLGDIISYPHYVYIYTLYISYIPFINHHESPFYHQHGMNLSSQERSHPANLARWGCWGWGEVFPLSMVDGLV